MTTAAAPWSSGTKTEPLKGYYQAKGLLTLVENRPTIEATTQAIMEALQS